MKPRVWSAVAVALLLAPAVRAQSHPSQRTGQEVPTAYAVGDVDAVQLFNGNLVINLPIGGAYPLSPALSLQLALRYNSNTWDFEAGGALGTGEESVIARPSPHSNAGLGWNLSVAGTLYEADTPIFNEGTASWLLVESDGTRRFFADDIHHNDPEPNGNGVLYSQDGSYLRLKELSSTIVEIESPNGVIRRYGRIPSTGIFELSEIRDRFGNRTAVTAGFEGFQPAWIIQDFTAANPTTVLREHRIVFDIFEYDDWDLKQVRQVRLAKFGGGSAIYNFEYSEESPGVPRLIERHLKHTADEFPPGPLHVPQTVRVPLLERVRLPTDVTDDPEYVFTSYEANADNPLSEDSLDVNISGTIASLTLPTLGKIEWTYGRYFFNLGTNPDPPHVWTSSNDGVRTRAVSSTISDTPAGTWRYEQLPRPTWMASCTPNCLREVRTWVTDPLNQTTVHFFHTEGGSWRHGLPFTLNTSDGGGLFLSRHIYSANPNVEANMRRSEWVKYTADWNPGLSEGRENQRLVASKTIFEDDGDRWVKTENTTFDGLGHFRVATFSASSNFDSLGNRVETTNINPGVGEFIVDPDTGTQQPGFTMLATSAPWVLDTFTYRQQTEGGVHAKQEFGFEASTGFLQTVRTLKTGTSQGSTDLYTLRCKGTSGFATTEAYYGGDAPSYTLPGTLPSCASFGTWQYRLDHTFESGSLETTRYRRPDNSQLPFFSYKADIDASTGKASNEYDLSDYRTKFTYDSLGRILTIEPRGPASGSDVSEAGAKTSYFYTGAGGSSGARVEVTTECPTGAGCSTQFAFRHVVLDGFGRVKIERFDQATGARARRDTRYNVLGWKTQVSEWDTPETAVPDEWTYFLNFDVFGRPEIMRPPDGSAHDVTFDYDGVRRILRTSKVKTALGSGAETNALTIEAYDRYGRLVKVQEPTGGVPNTDYAYDIGGRLKSVVQTSGLTTQNRTFSYDNRGFLTSEVHPEKGGAVLYTEYDARGHAHKMQDGALGPVLQFDFDKAERLERVINTGGGNTMKEWTFYASGNSLGKVHTATRWNVLTGIGTYSVVETLTYGSYERRPTGRSTLIKKDGVNMETFDQSWTYERDGNVKNVVYPTCTGGICSSGAPASRTAVNNYSNGFLTSVTGWASSITYHPNQMIHQVVHANGVTDTVANDPDTMRRPQSISTSGVIGGLNWNSGTYVYDGTGNIEEIGTDEYAYDLVSRLYNSEVEGKTQEYSFDAFGNIQWIKTAGVQVNYPTTQTTNRLTSGGYGTTGVLQNWNGATYTYDFLNMMKRYVNGSEDTSYVYTAHDERIMYTLNACGISGCGPQAYLTVRDLDGKVLREIAGPNQGGGEGRPGLDSGTDSPQGGVLWAKDYVYRDGQLLATAMPGEAAGSHFHLDHLGTPRLFTSNTGSRISLHTYFPFGQEATDLDQDGERMKFTGHERDLLGTVESSADDLDYLHTRYYSPLASRFFSFDPAPGDSRVSQGWNRFSYARGNPVRYIDPDGEDARDVLVGFLNAFGSNMLLGAGRQEAPNTDFGRGQQLGDLAAFAAGAVETQRGMGLVATGFAAEALSGGASTGPSGIVVAQGGALLAHGTGVMIAASRMLGEHGTQTTSTTVYKSEQGRIDVENPNPGQRAGQVHLQTSDNKKYMYDPESKQFKNAPKWVQKLLQDRRVQKAIEKAMKILGEYVPDPPPSR